MIQNQAATAMARATKNAAMSRKFSTYVVADGGSATGRMLLARPDACATC